MTTKSKLPPESRKLLVSSTIESHFCNAGLDAFGILKKAVVR